MDPGATRFNLTQANIIVLESNQHAADLLGQMLKGMGAGHVLRFTSVDECRKQVKTQAPDLIIAEPKLRQGDGYEFLHSLRHCGTEPLCFTPIVLVSGHSTPSEVKRARDTGANFFLTKPFSPRVLLERILWIARDPRSFVEVGSFFGPDRRFKFEGPPPGSDGRRANDLTDPIGEAAMPNMSQEEINRMLKPQRVAS